MKPIEVILVNENDEEIGTMEKLEAHQKGLLHRAVSIYVFNEKTELLLQLRSIKKYHCGGLWTNTCCGHPLPGESSLESAHRRLYEEMGFDCELNKAFEFKYKLAVTDGLTENEYGHIFFGEYKGDVNINPEEADDFKYVPVSEVATQLKLAPENYTPWFKLVFGNVLEHLEKPGKIQYTEK